MAIDKLERQLGLLAALLHTEHPLRAAEIQTRVAGYPQESVAFRRAFERDKEDLRRLGVPLEVQRTESNDGPIDGYRVTQSDYYLHDLGLEPDEVIALSMALRLIRMEGVATDDALWKLGGSTVPGEGEAPELAAIAMGPAVTQFHQAIATASVVSFSYRGEDRIVEPWRLAFRRGQWYLNGFDTARDDARSFRLDRIDGVVEVHDAGTAKTPKPVASAERQPWQFGTEDDDEFLARVAIDASHARWATHHLRDATVVTEHPDGSIEIELAVTNVGGFRSLVLSMSDSAEVLGPQELRDDMISWLEGLASA